MKVKRVVSVYDLTSDKLIKEISIDNIPIDDLRIILHVDNNDIDVYQVYPISDEQLHKFITYIPELSDLNIDNAGLFVECFQV